MDNTYISNNCGCIGYYYQKNRQYDHPFIGCLFVNDKEYVKFCKKFDYYLNVKPIFGHPKEDSIWAKQNEGVWYKHVEIKTPYPVMYLDDIEIHWIHENNEIELMEKYNKRLNRINKNNNIIFMLSDGDLCNSHTREERQELLYEFISVSNSIFLTKYPEDVSINERILLVDKWVDSDDERNSSHIPIIQTTVERLDYYKVIINKFYKY